MNERILKSSKLQPRKKITPQVEYLVITIDL